jgi:hypothetical protein
MALPAAVETIACHLLYTINIGLIELLDTYIPWHV